jgi:hypothetical protein
MSSVVTLAGIALQLEPETVLYRAAASGAVVFVAVSMTAGLCQQGRPDAEED